MKRTRQNLVYVSLIVLIVVLPTVIALGWYQITRDPNFRPLGITREALRNFGDPSMGVDLIAYIEWPAAETESPARRKLAADLAASFAAKGVEPRLVFRTSNGAPQVTYMIGKSVIGPYPVSRAAAGIEAAIDAYRMY